MTRLQSALVLCCALVFVAHAQSVNAQGAPAAKPSEASKEDASAHFKRGAELFQDGLYRAALVELRRAYEIAPNYRVLYNIGQTHVALGEFVEAIRAYQDFLAEGGAAVSAARRAEVEAELAQLRHNTATLTIRVNRDGAAVLVDGKNVGTSPLAQGVPVNVGHHQVSARAEDGSAGSADVEVAGGDQKEVAVEIVAPRVATAPAVEGASIPPKHKLSKRQRWAVGVLSSAVALAVTGGAMAFVAKSANDDYKKELDTRPGNPDDIDGARDRLWRTSLSADIMFGAAALAAVGGAVLLFTKGRQRGEKPDEKSVEVRVGLGPRALIAEGRF